MSEFGDWEDFDDSVLRSPERTAELCDFAKKFVEKHVSRQSSELSFRLNLEKIAFESVLDTEFTRDLIESTVREHTGDKFVSYTQDDAKPLVFILNINSPFTVSRHDPSWIPDINWIKDKFEKRIERQPNRQAFVDARNSGIDEWKSILEYNTWDEPTRSSMFELYPKHVYLNDFHACYESQRSKSTSVSEHPFFVNLKSRDKELYLQVMEDYRNYCKAIDGVKIKQTYPGESTCIFITFPYDYVTAMRLVDPVLNALKSSDTKYKDIKYKQQLTYRETDSKEVIDNARRNKGICLKHPKEVSMMAIYLKSKDSYVNRPREFEKKSGHWRAGARAAKGNCRAKGKK